MMISLHGYVSGEAELGLPDTGGQVVYVLKLSECLARLGYKVDIFTRRFEDQPAIETLGDRLRIVRIPSGGSKLIRKEWMGDVIPEWVANAQAWIERKDLNYMFIDSHYWDAGLAGDGLSKSLSIPHLHTPHSIGSWKRDNMDGTPDELDREYNFSHRIREERAIYDSADAIIATTPQQREILLGDEYEVDPDKIAVIPPGFEDTRFFPVSTATRTAIKRDLGVEGKLILAIGRTAANKGYDLLVDAMPTVFERVPDAKLMLAVGSSTPTPGEVLQIDALKRQAVELGIADRVLIRDFVPDEELADMYRAADVFALSSRYEPFGMTAIEAMACGTPVVMTTEGGLWEMIGWGTEAIYENPNDPTAFGHAIATILRYPRVARQLARGGSDRARATFTWNGIAQQLINRLQDAGDRRRHTAISRGPGAAVDLDAALDREQGWIPVGSS
jgi:mannosylfructose-phosphate synthase